MDFIKKNKLLISLSFIVLILLIIVSTFLISLTKNENVPTKDSETSEETLEETLIDEHTHEHYIPEIDSVLTTKENLVDDLIFGEPITRKNAINPGSGSSLFGGGNNYALMLQYGGELYLYDIHNQDPFVIERNISYGSLNKEETFVLYTQYDNSIKKEEQTIKIFNIDKKIRKDVGTLPTGFSIENSAYHNGMYFIFAKNDTNTSFITDVIVADEQLASNYPSFKSLLANHNFTIFKQQGTSLYAYDQNNRTIYDITNGNAVTKITSPSPIVDFAISENNTFLIYEGSNYFGEEIFELNGIKMDKWSAVSDPIWLNNNNLLFTDTYNLYVYNILSQKLSPLLSGVHSIYVGEKQIFAQNADGTSYVKTIEYTAN